MGGSRESGENVNAVNALRLPLALNVGEPCHAPEWRWPAFPEIKVNSRHPVMAVVRGISCAWRLVRGLMLLLVLVVLLSASLSSMNRLRRMGP
jgi:hypothetical protein